MEWRWTGESLQCVIKCVGHFKGTRIESIIEKFDATPDFPQFPLTIRKFIWYCQSYHKWNVNKFNIQNVFFPFERIIRASIESSIDDVTINESILGVRYRTLAKYLSTSIDIPIDISNIILHHVTSIYLQEKRFPTLILDEAEKISHDFISKNIDMSIIRSYINLVGPMRSTKLKIYLFTRICFGLGYHIKNNRINLSSICIEIASYEDLYKIKNNPFYCLLLM